MTTSDCGFAFALFFWLVCFIGISIFLIGFPRRDNANDVALGSGSVPSIHQLSRCALTPGKKAVSDAVRVEARFYFFANFLALRSPPIEVDLHFGLPLQIVGDYGVNVGQVEGGVLLDNLLRSGAFIEGEDDRIERHARAPDAHHTVGVSGERNWLL